jgi:flagellar FliL protein
MAKAPAKKEEKKPEAEAEGEEQQPKKKGKLPLIIGLVVLLAAVVGGGAWFFMFRDKGGEAATQQAKPQPPKPPVFVPLDAFTVNLSSEQGDQYLQVAATLKVLDQGAADAIKQYMPELRHKTLVLLSTKRPQEIASGEGRERLAEELRQTANNVLLAAVGKPVKPIVIDVPKPVAEGAAAAEAPKQEEAPKADEAKPQEGAAADAGTAAPPAPPQPAPTPAAAPKPATVLSKAAADDPVQSVFFTSFIIQ